MQTNARFLSYILLNASFQHPLGMFNGKAACFLHLQALSTNSEYEYLGNTLFSLLDETHALINRSTSTGFGDGLAGYGSLLEYLNTNGFINENTSELLEEPDNYILSRVYSGQLNITGLHAGISGLGLYLVHRLQSRTPPGQFQYMRLKEAAIACIDQLYSLWRNEVKMGRNKLDTNFWTGWPGTLVFVLQMQKLQWYEPLTSQLEGEITDALIKVLTKNKDLFNWECLDIWFAILQSHKGHINSEKLKILDRLIQKGFFQIKDLPFPLMMWKAIEAYGIAKAYAFSPAEKLSNKIQQTVLEILSKHTLPELFPMNNEIRSVPVGLAYGVSGTGLPLFSFGTRDFKWLNILGIDI